MRDIVGFPGFGSKDNYQTISATKGKSNVSINS